MKYWLVMATACIQKVKLCTLKPLKLNIIRSTLVKFTILTPQDLNIDSERDDTTSAHIWIFFVCVCAALKQGQIIITGYRIMYGYKTFSLFTSFNGKQLGMCIFKKLVKYFNKLDYTKTCCPCGR